jgi:molybdopterin molybdotransferase
MKPFFAVTPLAEVLALAADFPPVSTETVPLDEALGRVLAEDLMSPEELPATPRASMDGYAVRASSTFGAGEGSPAWLTICGQVVMGQQPQFVVAPGQAARIGTGGVLPAGADAVVMVEHSEAVDETTVEIYRSVAPGQHVMLAGEDLRRGSVALRGGRRLRPQELGLLAALGISRLPVFRRPVVAILSTGDEIVPVSVTPGPGQIRDVNAHTLAALVRRSGGDPWLMGICADHPGELCRRCSEALEHCDLLLLSGGSSVGARDFTVEAFQSLPEARLLVHGISVSPGKPTLLARAGHRALWGLPGQVTSAMVVFAVVVRPFLERIAGCAPTAISGHRIAARLSRNLASAQGRIDYVRVRIREADGVRWADPVLGKSGLIHTMLQADGLVEIDMHVEGLEQGTPVEIIPL